MRTCTSTRMGLHPISHASLVTGGVRRSNRGGTSRRKLRGSVVSERSCGLPLLRFSGLRVSHVSWAHRKVPLMGVKVTAFGVRVSSPGVGENA